MSIATRDGRAERPRHVRRQVVHHQAVHERAAFPLHRREEHRDRHAGASGTGEVASREDHTLPAREIRRHRAKRDREPVEVPAHPIARGRQVLDQEAVHAVLGQQPPGQARLRAVEAHAEQVAVAVGPPHDRQRAPVGPPAEERGPVERAHDRLELGGAAPRGVDAADDRAHAVGRDRVHWQPRLLERPQRTHVRDPARPAARERERQPGTWHGRRVLRDGGRLRGGSGGGYQALGHEHDAAQARHLAPLRGFPVYSRTPRGRWSRTRSRLVASPLFG